MVAVAVVVVVPDLPQRLKTFALLRVIFAVLANRASARIADAAIALRNVLAPVYDRFDIVCVEDDIVFELELAVEVRYEEIYFAAVFASAIALAVAASAVAAELGTATEHSAVEAAALAAVRW